MVNVLAKLLNRLSLGWIMIFIAYGFGGTDWKWEEKASMPMATSNNAVASGMSGGKNYVYSFGGIDTSKIWSGLHLKCFRYDVDNDFWDSIPDLPDTKGKIAAAASTIKNRIYITGGYYVATNGDETSSQHIHIFDPETNQFLSDGKRLPVVTDDHVQAVWRDSLLYVISGWSDSLPGPAGGGNINLVQIYDPSSNSWIQGTPVPNNNDYKVFGASGTIIGDTIFYAGGVYDSWPFSVVPVLRIGVIDPQQPDSIQWSVINDTLAGIYRSSAFQYLGTAYWLGGANKAYNFDGLEYVTNNGVEPLSQILSYEQSVFLSNNNVISPVMDLRGVGQTGNGQFVIAGGMLSGQQVSNKTYVLTDMDLSYDRKVLLDMEIAVYPNPSKEYIFIDISAYSGNDKFISLIDVTGSIRYQVIEKHDHHIISVSDLSPGLYLLSIKISERNVLTNKIIVEY